MDVRWRIRWRLIESFFQLWMKHRCSRPPICQVLFGRRLALIKSQKFANKSSKRTNLQTRRCVLYSRHIFFYSNLCRKIFSIETLQYLFFFSQNTLKWMFIKGFLNGRRGGDDNLNKRPWNQQERAIRNDSDVVEDKSKKQKRWLYTVFGP